MIAVREQTGVRSPAYHPRLLRGEDAAVEDADALHEGAIGVGARGHAWASPDRCTPNRHALRDVFNRAIRGNDGMPALTEPKLLYFYSPKSGPSRRVEAFLDQVLQERRNHAVF